MSGLFGPVRLESAVQDMTRGVHSVLQFNKSLQPGAIAMMTTSDAKLLNGMDDAVDKALWPIVSLRKVLKSIRGNVARRRSPRPPSPPAAHSRHASRSPPSQTALLAALVPILHWVGRVRKILYKNQVIDICSEVNA